MSNPTLNCKKCPSENLTKNDKNKLITYSIIGFSLLTLIGLAYLLLKPKQKKPKIK